MFSGEIGSLQPRTSYAVARTIGRIDRGRNFVGFEEIFARRREQREAVTASTLAQSSQKSKASSGRITGMR
jgi:hypothetical protein